MDVFTDLHEHFLLEITLAQIKTQSKINSNIEFYLVNMLSDLHLSQKPLFDHFEQAINGNNRLLSAKALGDEALIISSIFPEFAKRRGRSIDYCMDMGKRGYSMAAEIFRKEYRDQHFADLYTEMSVEFGTLRYVLSKTVDIFNVDKAP